MKVIGRDSLDRDYNNGRDEEVAATGLTEAAAIMLADSLNAQARNGFNDIWYVVKPEDYQPYVFKGY